MFKLALPLHLDMNIAGDLLMEGVVGIAVVIIMLETADGETENGTEWFVKTFPCWRQLPSCWRRLLAGSCTIVVHEAPNFP